MTHKHENILYDKISCFIFYLSLYNKMASCMLVNKQWIGVGGPPPKKKTHTHTHIYIYICATKITLKHIYNKCEVIFLHKLHFLTEKVPLSRHMFDLCFECQPDLNRKCNNLMRWHLRTYNLISKKMYGCSKQARRSTCYTQWWIKTLWCPWATTPRGPQPATPRYTTSNSKINGWMKVMCFMWYIFFCAKCYINKLIW